MTDPRFSVLIEGYSCFEGLRWHAREASIWTTQVRVPGPGTP